MSCEIKNSFISEKQEIQVDENDQINSVKMNLKNESDIKSSRVSIEIIKSNSDPNIEKKKNRHSQITSILGQSTINKKNELSKKAKTANELPNLRPLLVKYVLLDPNTTISNVLNLVDEYNVRLGSETEISNLSGAFQASPKMSVHLQDLKEILLENKGIEDLQKCNSLFHHRIPCAIKSLCTIITEAKAEAKRDSYKLKQLQSSLIELTKKILELSPSMSLPHFVQSAPGVAYIITDIDPIKPTLENQNLYAKHMNIVISAFEKILTKEN